MKHTNGKWEPCKYGTRPNLKNAVVVWHEDHHTPIAKCVGDKSQANANLIANAPEMLAMLKETIDNAETVRGYANIKPDSLQEQILNNIINRCGYLIAKAEVGAS